MSNPIADGNKTVTGLVALGSGGYTAAALAILPQLGIDSKMLEIGISLAPGAIGVVIGLGHKLIKVGGIVGLWKSFRKNIIGN